MKIISIVNHKGGVAKTTSTINLGAAFAIQGKRCLLVDLDPQAHTSLGTLGSNYENENHSFLEDAINNCILDQDEKAILVPVPFINNVDVIPSTLELAGSEMSMINAKARERILFNLLKKFNGKYDYVLIDCPPSLNLLTQNALMASDYVLVPVEGEYFSMKGIEKIHKLIDLLKRKLDGKTEILGYFMTKYDDRKLLNKDIRKSLIESLGKEVFNTVIRPNVALGEMEYNTSDIFSYAPDSNGAKDYMALAEEILNKIDK